ncbi:MAG TPA: DUF2771 family protein [Jatrophihabitans sp.]|nr:DUF2771 family protein [Jatrophihabitans sp.]
MSLRRAVAAVVALFAATVLLTACDKPQPTITVLSGDRATTVPAQSTCTILTAGTCALDPGKQRTVHARSGSTLLLDVPPALSDRGYIVAAYTTDGKTNTPLSTPGASTGPTTGKLALRLAVPSQAQGSYYLQISAIPPSRQLTTWLVLVQLTA